jgi:hypothetical protein
MSKPNEARDMRRSGWWNAKRRAAARTLPIICPRCGRWVKRGDKWDLGHVIPVALGGMYGPTQVEHRSCNREQGKLIAGGYRTYTTGPSRAW